MPAKQNKSLRQEVNTAIAPAAYPVSEFCYRLSISESFFWKLVNEGRINVVRLGRKCLIPASELERLLKGAAS